MPYGLYISAAGAEAQSRRIEVIANNLANVDTTGFKRDLAVLQSLPSAATEQGLDYHGSRSINDLGGGVTLAETQTEYATGTLKQTGVPTDLAIDGDGFFTVEKDGKPMLTRAGNFHFDNQGRLMTVSGQPVLGSEGRPIVIDPTLPVSINQSGQVQQGAEIVGQIGMVAPKSRGDLVKVGDNLFASLAATEPVPPGQRSVRSGYLEQANVRPAQEMIQMIEASRAFEANMRLIQNQDNVIGTLVTRVLREG